MTACINKERWWSVESDQQHIAVQHVNSMQRVESTERKAAAGATTAITHSQFIMCI
jgi:hypothetical protein